VNDKGMYASTHKHGDPALRRFDPLHHDMFRYEGTLSLKYAILEECDGVVRQLISSIVVQISYLTGRVQANAARFSSPGYGTIS
jgi:hypothetical protein